MAAISAREFERSLNEKLDGIRVIVLVGDNDEIKSDLFRAVRKSLGIDPEDPFRFVQLDSSILDSDPARLADELGAISMFGGSRLIRTNATARQAERIIRQAFDGPSGDWTLVVDTDEVELSRIAADVAARLLVVACGATEAGDFHSFVQSECTRAGIGAEDGALELLIGLLGDDRASARTEIEKLSLLIGASNRITVDDVRNVVADGSSILADEIATAALSGNLTRVVEALDRLQSTGADPTAPLGAASRLALNLYRAKVNQWRARPDGVAQNLNSGDLRSIALGLQAAVLQSRSEGSNSALLAERALISLGNAARTRRR